MSEQLQEPAAPEFEAEPEPITEPATPAPSVEEFQALQQQLQELQQIVQPPPPPWQQQQQPAPPVPNPFDDDYAQQFQAYTDAQMAPYREFQRQIAVSQAVEQGMEILDNLAQSGGEFDRDLAWAVANQLVQEQGLDAQKALEEAAKRVRDHERQVGEAYYQQQIQQLQTGAGARTGLPVRTAGGQTVATGGYGNVPGAVTARMFGRS